MVKKPKSIIFVASLRFDLHHSPVHIVIAQKENFAKCDWPAQIFRRKEILKLKNFQLLTMIF